MRIAMVHPCLVTRGGAENVVIWLAEELANRGHEVTLFTSEYDDTYWGDKDKKGFAIEELKVNGYRSGIVDWIRAGFKLRSVLQKFDIVNPHNYPAYIWVYFALKLSCQKFPTIIWYCEEPPRRLYRGIIDAHCLHLLPSAENRRTGLSPKWQEGRFKIVFSLFKYTYKFFSTRIYRQLDKRAVSSISLILTNSNFINSYIKKIYHLRAQTCYLGIPVKKFLSDEEPRYREKDYVCTVSRLNPEKNIVSVLMAIDLIVKKKTPTEVPKIELKIVGAGPEEENLKKLAKELNLEDYVHFLGFISHKKLRKIYAESKLVIYTPLDETFGLPFLEAALYKKPVIAPNHGGPTELVINGVTGIQVDPLAPGEIARAIVRILVDPNLAEKLGEAGYRKVLANFTFYKFVNRFEKMISKESSECGSG